MIMHGAEKFNFEFCMLLKQIIKFMNFDTQFIACRYAGELLFNKNSETCLLSALSLLD